MPHEKRELQIWSEILNGSLLSAFSTVDTPAVYFSERQLVSNIEAYEQVLTNNCLRYAVKACPLKRVLQCLASRGWGADCQSVMEAKLALAAGFPPEKISICSPRLSPTELHWALQQRIRIIADSRSQLSLIAKAVPPEIEPREWPLGVRISLPVKGTERFHTKLGMEQDDIIHTLRELPKLSPYLTEIHHHGSAREVSTELFTAISTAMAHAIESIENALDIHFTSINLGGGYEPDSILHCYGLSMETIAKEGLSPFTALGQRTVILEPGRALTKDAAVAITTVNNLKKLKHRNLAVVDVSTNLLIPLPLASFFAEPLTHHLAPQVTYDIVDGTCSPAGVICRDTPLPMLSEGSRLVVFDVGAYTWSLVEPFYHDLPTLWWIDEQDRNTPLITTDELSRARDLFWGY